MPDGTRSGADAGGPGHGATAPSWLSGGLSPSSAGGHSPFGAQSQPARGLDPSSIVVAETLPAPAVATQPENRKAFGDKLKDELHLDHATANSHLLVQVEQGPAWLRWMAMIGGLLAVLNAIIAMVLHFQSIGIIALYQAFFAMITVLFEAPPTWVHSVSPASRFQDVLKDRAAFLVELLSRGVFYIFQGTMWLSICWALRVRSTHMLCGAYMVLAGILTAIGHYANWGKTVAAVGEEASMALGPKIGRTQNTQERAQKLAEIHVSKQPVASD